MARDEEEGQYHYLSNYHISMSTHKLECCSCYKNSATSFFGWAAMPLSCIKKREYIRCGSNLNRSLTNVDHFRVKQIYNLCTPLARTIPPTFTIKAASHSTFHHQRHGSTRFIQSSHSSIIHRFISSLNFISVSFIH